MHVETGNPTDEATEAAITAAALTLATARTPAARRKAWAELQALHARRSRNYVLRMEEQLGLTTAGN